MSKKLSNVLLEIVPENERMIRELIVLYDTYSPNSACLTSINKIIERINETEHPEWSEKALQQITEFFTS